MTCTPGPGREVYLYLWEVSSLVTNELGSGEHFFQSIQDIRPKEVSVKMIQA